MSAELSRKLRVLIAEDDVALAKALEASFQGENFDVVKTGKGSECVQLALKHAPDLILLDQMLEDGSGVDVCRELRQRRVQSIIIFVTVRGQEIDKVVGLEVGADDYVTKPFSLRELLARARAHLRRQTQAPTAAPSLTHWRLGDVEINFQQYTARRKNRALEMTPKEFELLHLLVTHPGEVLSRDQILEQIWGYETSTTTRTVDTHVSNLRQKLEPDPAHPRYIISIYGEGYKFVG
ncbi:MAG: response regulator transcription factor [Terriglobales bacterium]